MNKYNVPANPPLDQAAKKLYEDNSKAMNAILSGLVKKIFVKVMHCETVKEMWDKLKTSMKEMTKSKGQNFRPIEDNLRI